MTVAQGTPRTDSLLLKINEGRIYAQYGPMTELCRQLERELAKMTWTANMNFRDAFDLRIKLEASRATEGNARESARDAGSGINKEVVAPDQGSVRNATDELANDAEALLLHIRDVLELRGGPEFAGIDQWLARKAIRALPDQKD